MEVVDGSGKPIGVESVAPACRLGHELDGLGKVLPVVEGVPEGDQTGDGVVVPIDDPEGVDRCWVEGKLVAHRARQRIV